MDWGLGNLGFVIIVWLNMVALTFLIKPALQALKDYDVQRRAGKDSVFDPKVARIANANFWERVGD